MHRNETKKCLRIDNRPKDRHHDFLNEIKYLDRRRLNVRHLDQSLDSCTAVLRVVRLGTGIASI